MEYITIEKAAEKWGLSLRRAQDLCKLGRVPGAKRFGTNWMVPENADRPADGRRKAVKEIPAASLPLIRKSPFLTMTDLYNTPGTADDCIEALAFHPGADR